MSSPEGFDEPPRHSARKLEARRSSRGRRATGVACRPIGDDQFWPATLSEASGTRRTLWPLWLRLPSAGSREMSR